MIRRTTLALPVLLAAAVLATPWAAGADSLPGGSWQLDETSGGVAFDSSGNGNNGLLRGQVETGFPGHTGTAYSFAHDGAWVEVPSNAGLNPGTSDFRYTAWVMLIAAPPAGVTYDIIRKGLSGTATGEFKVEVIKNGLVKCTTKDSARVLGAITRSKVNVADGTWHQIGCARVGSSWQVLVDGTVRSKTVSLGSIGNAKSLSIGSKYGKEDGTPGLVDDVQLTIG